MYLCLFQLSATLLVLLHLSMNVVDEGHAVNPSEFDVDYVTRTNFQYNCVIVSV